MNVSDLYALGERFDQNRTLLCFNGPISRSLIEEIGNALKNYLNAEHARPAEAMDVFSVYIEMIQNIRQYAAQNGDTDAAATVVIGRRGGAATWCRPATWSRPRTAAAWWPASSSWPRWTRPP
ncbi:DUF6272 family protein [Achromobacter insuavis]